MILCRAAAQWPSVGTGLNGGGASRHAHLSRDGAHRYYLTVAFRPAMGKLAPEMRCARTYSCESPYQTGRILAYAHPNLGVRDTDIRDVTFNSLAFCIFLPIVLVVYYALTRRAQNAWLLCASYFFYGWWDWRFLALLALSTSIDYVAALNIDRSDDRLTRRRFLCLSLGTNLVVLGFFKYFNFFSRSAFELLSAIGISASLPVLQIVLPVGISFYTFQSMSYTIDVYRRRIQPRRDLLTFALFVSYFPQLVAGPIERAASLLPQFESNRRVTWTGLHDGLVLILVGLFKKVAVADALAPFVDVRFGNPQMASGGDLLVSLYLFSIQIYCDFSGYSDIARGTSKLLGIELRQNFGRPFFSRSIAEFWTRWHVSLSEWLRDYLFLPLSYSLSRKVDGLRLPGSRDELWVYGAAASLTMLIGGLWHGASWTFVAWGGLHGLYLAGHRLWVARWGKRRRRGVARWAAHWISVFLTFHLVTLAWVFFRADSFDAAWDYLTGIALWQQARGIEPLDWASTRIVALVGTMLLIDLLQEGAARKMAWQDVDWRLQGFAYAALVVETLLLGNVLGNVPFIYFQF